MSEVAASRGIPKRSRPKGYAPWQPRKASRVLIAAVQDILAEYEKHLPLSVRQIFYRLVGAYDYPKTEAAYESLAEKLVRARRASMIPFESIRDDGVVTINQETYGSIKDFHDVTARRINAYRRDRQAGQPVKIELWSEAAGMLGQLDRVAAEYSVQTYSAGGFGSTTANYDISRRALAPTVPTVMLHVGDYDPSGVSIFKAASEDAAQFVVADRVLANLEIIPVRVTLTAEQVETYNLPTAPPKRSDSRSATWKGETCQLEALTPTQIAAIVRDAIEEHLDLDIYRRVLREEAHDRAELLALPPGADQ